MPQMTTTKGFRVDDITFRGARRQSEILNEIEPDEVQEVKVEVPVSLTPEQVINFYKNKIKTSQDSNEKRLYSQTIIWIAELLYTKKKLFALENKQVKEESEDYDNGIEE